jgi:transcriptional regulator with XRE-family HTH domain
MTKGKRLKTVRQARDLDQIEMATQIGVTQSSYSRMENDRLSVSEDALIGLTRIGINIGWILTGEGAMYVVKELEPDETNNLLNEMSHQMRVMRDDMDKIENTLKKLMGRK